MKLHLRDERRHALTITEVMVVMVILFILGASFLVLLPSAVRRTQKRNFSELICISNLHQVDLSFLIWANDHEGKYPMEVSVADGGASELIAAGDVPGCYRVISNELSTPEVLACPADEQRSEATNFDDLKASHISYFIGPDAKTNEVQRILCGDDNFQMNGMAVGSGMLSLSTNTPVIWGPGRHGEAPHHFWAQIPHRFYGNIGHPDGSVWEMGNANLETALQQTGMATNRFAIP